MNKLWTMIVGKEDNGIEILEEAIRKYRDKIVDYDMSKDFAMVSILGVVTVRNYTIITTEEVYNKIIEELERELKVRAFSI